MREQIDTVQEPKIILSHETVNSIGSWAITPILASSTEYIDSIILSQRNSKIDLPAAKSNSHNVSSLTQSDAITSSSPSPSSAIETKWLILCEDQSIVDLKALINNLEHEDYTKVSSFCIIIIIIIRFLVFGFWYLVLNVHCSYCVHAVWLRNMWRMEFSHTNTKDVLQNVVGIISVLNIRFIIRSQVLYKIRNMKKDNEKEMKNNVHKICMREH